MSAPERCPCGTGETLAACCQPFHDGVAGPPTATALMRSRFSAFALGRADYLTRTWHESTRPRQIELDERMRWTDLEIISSAGGGPFADTGTVEFRAHFLVGRTSDELHERSSFVRENGQWYYVDGVLDP